MANYEDYAKKYLKQEEGLKEEITQAADAQVTREAAAPENVEQSFQTPDRFVGKSVEEVIQSYNALEQMNSRQAQDLGAMRTLVDSLATNPNPTATPEPVQEPAPITADDLYDKPAETLNKVVDAHPALARLDKIEAELNARNVEAAQVSFAEKHPDYEAIGTDPAFQNWVASDATRIDLYGRADSFDFGAADALLSLYKAENKITTISGEVQRQEQLNAGMLETSGSYEPPAPTTYSRTDWLNKMTRAKQGDLAAEDYINNHSKAYRAALGSGNVRD